MTLHRRRFIASSLATAATLAGLGSLGTRTAFASTSLMAPTKETFFICPSVSTNNSRGMWVVGKHGGYYVIIPTQGGTQSGSKVYLTIPVQVTSLAQIPAGWALYSSLPSYPNFEGTAVLLSEGIDTWLGSPAGWQEGDMAMIAAKGDGTYTVTNTRVGASLVIDQPIPLASAAVW